MKILARTRESSVAAVFMGETSEKKPVEFVESLQPPLHREEKWVLIISTLYGCPVGCRFCDAAGFYQGKVSRDDMLDQIDTLVDLYYPDRVLPMPKFKIQFARMGEPALNHQVLDVLRELPSRYRAPGLLPVISTIAPRGSDPFFKALLDIKRSLYPQNFQMQFSLHTTDAKMRRWLIPAAVWPFEKIAEYGAEFFQQGGRKITLNFALCEQSPLDAAVLAGYFDPEMFMVKITPVNPTVRAGSSGLTSAVDAGTAEAVVRSLQEYGFDVIVSIGEKEENRIGSNCGQYVSRYLQNGSRPDGSYTYELEKVSG